MEQAVSCHVHRDMGALDGDTHISKAAVLQQPDMAQRAFRQRFGGDAAVFAENILFQLAAVDTHPDGNAALAAAIGYGPDSVR